MLSDHTPDTISEVPTAQSVYDALRVSPYMDHVVDAWLSAYVSMKAAIAAEEITDGGFSALEAKKHFSEVYAEMLGRWHEYKR